MNSLTPENTNCTEPHRVCETNLNFMLPRAVKQQIEDIAWQRRISVAEYMRELIYKELNISSAKPS